MVIEILRGNGSIQKAFNRLTREELRREVQATVGKSQAVEDEGYHGAAGTDDARIMYGKKMVDAFGNPEVLADSGDECGWIQANCPLVDLIYLLTPLPSSMSCVSA